MKVSITLRNVTRRMPLTHDSQLWGQELGHAWRDGTGLSAVRLADNIVLLLLCVVGRSFGPSALMGS